MNSDAQHFRRRANRGVTEGKNLGRGELKQGDIHPVEEKNRGVPVPRKGGPPPEPRQIRAMERSSNCLRALDITSRELIRSDCEGDECCRIAQVCQTECHMRRHGDCDQRQCPTELAEMSGYELPPTIALDRFANRMLRTFRKVEYRRGTQVEPAAPLYLRDVTGRVRGSGLCLGIPGENSPKCERIVPLRGRQANAPLFSASMARITSERRPARNTSTGRRSPR